jgi:hypothetical protein
MLERVQKAAKLRLLFLPHAVRQMARPERLIAPREVRAVIDEGEIIEDYPEDARGHSCLILGSRHDGRAIHVVCAPKEDFLAIITAYVPTNDEWEAGFRRRKTK